MSPISAAARQAMYEQHTEEVPVLLAEVDHPDTPGVPPWPFRMCNNGVDIVSNGNTYLAGNFDVMLPDQESSAAEVALRLIVAGPPHVVVKELRQLTTVPVFRVAVVMASAPDTVLREWDELKLRNVEADNISIVFELRYEQLTQVPFPGYRYSLPLFPGLY